MILKSDIIADLLEKPDPLDPLVITPTPDIQDLRKSGAASVDLRLGSWFLTLREAKLAFIDIPDREASERFTKSVYVRFGDKFVLHPRSFVLGITLEWIRLKSDLAGIVTGKSSLDRRGLIIATATGVHPRFTGCLTLEITNLGAIPLKLTPGMPVCQLFLQRVYGESKTFDRSIFNARRKPILGRAEPDKFGEQLSRER